VQNAKEVMEEVIKIPVGELANEINREGEKSEAYSSSSL
jgi:hypothetical protein